MDVTVQNANRQPAANAGDDFAVSEGETATLIGSASGGDAPLTYGWAAPADITLTGANTDSPTFVAPTVDSNTVYTFTLTVTDSDGDSSEDSVDVTVQNANRQPADTQNNSSSTTPLSVHVLNQAPTTNASSPVLVSPPPPPTQKFKVVSPLDGQTIRTTSVVTFNGTAEPYSDVVVGNDSAHYTKADANGDWYVDVQFEAGGTYNITSTTSSSTGIETELVTITVVLYELRTCR